MDLEKRVREWVRMKRLRERKTQTELAEMVGFKERSVLAKIESGDRQVSLREFVELCEALDEDPAVVLGKLLNQEITPV